jgi:DNA-binding response OmpR family regulator
MKEELMPLMPLVLLVEDDPDLRSFLLQALAHFGGFRMAGAADGIAGLAACMEAVPACMVIDVKMPGLDGFQLVRALRGDPQTAAVPVIILTALAQDQDRFVGLASGADRFMQKPVKPQVLAQAIHEVIALNEAERQRRYQAWAEEVAADHE